MRHEVKYRGLTATLDKENNQYVIRNEIKGYLIVVQEKEVNIKLLYGMDLKLFHNISSLISQVEAEFIVNNIKS
jgi:hypothetical protein